MHRIIKIIIYLFFFSNIVISMDTKISIIPKPASVKMSDGSFTLNDSTIIIIMNNAGILKPIAKDLALQLRTVTNYPFKIVVSSKQKNNSIILMLNKNLRHLGKEGYSLSVSEKKIKIKAYAGNGIFYGIQSLLQLLPPEIESKELITNIDMTLPCVTIEDLPRFTWRGMHLDVGRHFFPVDFIKKYIDLLASYKMNTFHWHLTDDQGWRIEIKKYPLLTSIGSFRKETTGDSTPYGSFYTQEQIREIVKYANKKYVTIVPEIEMPGHSLAALTAYPDLSCTGGPFEVGTTWGVFEDVYCAGKEKTFSFLKDVLKEVISLFPGKYIHIGGDECPKTRWKNCPECQNRMKVNHLNDENELQSYFIHKIDKFLQSRGKRLVGWDEILEGGLTGGATVMSWRGTEGGIAAAKAGHDVIMTPTSHCYFDYYQGPPDSEPKAIGGFLPLDTVYAFDPVPQDIPPKRKKHVLGAQGNVWTEYMPYEKHVEYMVLPRLLAMSEVLWTPKHNKDFLDFKSRLNSHYKRLSLRNYNFRKSD